MEYEIKKESGSAVIEFTFSAEEWEGAQDAAFKEEAKQYQVQGFRKGKAPRKIIEQNYGKDVFTRTAIDKLFRPSYIKALDENLDIKPIGYPDLKVDETENGGLKLECKLDVEPEFKLGKYTGLEIKRADFKVTEKEVTGYLEQLRESRAKQIAADKAHKIANGDIAVIDFAGSIDGTEFKGGSAEKFELEIGSNSFIDTFEKQLVGAKVGDALEVNVTFPKDYHAKDCAGKPALFKVKIKNVLIKELPAIDDNLAKESSEFNTLAEFKESIKERLQKQADAEAVRTNENILLKTVSDQTKIDIPQSMIDTQYHNLMHDLEHRLEHQGANLEIYLAYLGVTAEEFEKKQREQAAIGVKLRLVSDAIMEKEKLSVTKEEAEAELKKLTEGDEKKIAAAIKEPEQMAYLEQELLFGKLIDFLTKNNKFV